MFFFEVSGWNMSVMQDGVLLGIERFIHVRSLVVLHSNWKPYANSRFESS